MGEHTMWKSQRCRRIFICFLPILVIALAAAPTFAANTCTNDAQGVDDEPGQKDLTQWCSGATGDYPGLGCQAANGFDFSLKWNWDDTGLSGGNTGDACALVDTDNDGKANYALCIDIANKPASIQYVRLYSCADDRLQRCTNSVLILTPPLHTFCSLNAAATDPFGGNHNCAGTNCKTADAAASCCFDTADVGGSAARLLDVCSYPSQQPNSDPSDCVITPTGQSPCTGVDCNDNNVCTTDSCNPDTGACIHTNNSLSCDDGSACTTADTCSGGVCVGGAAPNCNDGNLCTTDSCNPASGCTHTNNTLPCDDGSACTSGDACGGGACVGGQTLNCNDGNGCTDDGCNPASGCTHSNNTAPCDDGSACTTGDTCSGGACAGGAPPNCNDNNICTTDACNPASGCTHTNNTLPCDDGSACTTGDTCGGGSCVGGAAPNCNDNNLCTTDACNPASGCTHTNNTLPCDDGSACTLGDTCGGGVCVGGAAPNCNDNNVCTDDSCNPASGCTHTNNSASCDDGNACTTGDICAGGTCTQGTASVITGSGASCVDDAGCPVTEVCASTPSGGGVCVVRRGSSLAR